MIQVKYIAFLLTLSTLRPFCLSFGQGAENVKTIPGEEIGFESPVNDGAGNEGRVGSEPQLERSKRWGGEGGHQRTEQFLECGDHDFCFGVGSKCKNFDIGLFFVYFGTEDPCCGECDHDTGCCCSLGHGPCYSDEGGTEEQCCGDRKCIKDEHICCSKPTEHCDKTGHCCKVDNAEVADCETNKKICLLKLNQPCTRDSECGSGSCQDDVSDKKCTA